MLEMHDVLDESRFKDMLGVFPTDVDHVFIYCGICAGALLLCGVALRS